MKTYSIGKDTKRLQYWLVLPLTYFLNIFRELCPTKFKLFQENEEPSFYDFFLVQTLKF